MSFWKKTMDYLGLGPDDAYDDYDEQVEPEAARASRSTADTAAARRPFHGQQELAGGVRRDHHPGRAVTSQLPVAGLRVAEQPAHVAPG